MLVVALVRALVHVLLLAALPVDVTRLLRVRIRVTGRILDVVDPLSGGEQVVGLRVVRLPESSCVGGEGEAADLDAVSDHPRGDRDRRRGEDCQGSPAPAIAEDKVGAHGDGQEGEPHVSEHRQPSTDPGGRGPLDRPAFRGDERAEDERRSEELVEHLAVQVDVVPDEVRIQGRDHSVASSVSW